MNKKEGNFDAFPENSES